MCAKSPGDIFFLAPRLYGRSLGAHQVDSERRHLLPTQHGQSGTWSRCMAANPVHEAGKRVSLFASATSSITSFANKKPEVCTLAIPQVY